MLNKETNSKIIKINLQKNVRLNLNFGFGTLITAKNDENYRNATISIHNGLELLMKYYLKTKDKFLILQKINHHNLLNDRDDLIREVEPKKFTNYTISYNDCIDRLEYFSQHPSNYIVYLKQLNEKRNECVHYEYSYNVKELRKLLISHIYQFICDLILEMKLEINEFILDKYIDTLNTLKDTINDEIKQGYYAKIEGAKKHYFEELTEEERKQKINAEDYTQRKIDTLVKCPACGNNALLRKKIQHIHETAKKHDIIKRDLILEDLSCHHCGLNINDYDQLKPIFKDEERPLKSQIFYYDCPDDCPDYDCPDDCGPEDCPDDCGPEDCPDDCGPEDCPDDCGPEDCPDDCGPEDCPDDCGPEDCPDDCVQR